MPSQPSSEPVEIRDFCDESMPMPSKIYNSSLCPICQENFTEFERTALISCGHIFHINCINAALSHNPGICPICKTHGITRFRTLAYMPVS